MDVRLPDGTVVRGVPDGMTKADLAGKLKANGYDTSWYQPEPARTVPQEIGRQAGLTARSAIEGYVGGTAGILAAPIAMGYNNIARPLVNRLTQAVAGRDVLPEMMSPNAALSQTLTDVGLPQPETQQERLVADASRALSGAYGGIRTAQAVPGDVARLLEARAGTQAASAVAGGTAAGATREAGGDQWAQLGAGLFGGLTGPAFIDGIPALTRVAFRGGEQNISTMKDNIRAFERAGDRASVGQATGNRRTQGAESLLSRTPGGAGVMADRSQQQAANIGARIDEQAGKLAPKAGGEQAGRAIERGVATWTTNFRGIAERLYGRLDGFIKPDAAIRVDNTAVLLDELTAPIKGAENLSQQFINPKLVAINNALGEDLQASVARKAPVAPPPPTGLGSLGGAPPKVPMGPPGVPTMPYESMKLLRSKIGKLLSGGPLIDDLPRAELKAVYAALSSDLEAAAKAAGPRAEQAAKRANSFWRAGMDRMDVIERVVERAGGPERIFQAATSGSTEGATVLRAVMQSLPPDAQRAVTATVLRRLGRANASAQNETGGLFSTETFLTNYSKLSPEAKRTLFDRHGPGFRADMDNVAKVAANLRSGSQVFRNPSGTAQATVQTATAGTFLFSVLTGDAQTAGMVAAGVTGANLGARLMTHPPFVKWLATASRRPIGAIPGSLNQLAQQARAANDPLLAEAAAAYQAQLQNDQQKPRQ